MGNKNASPERPVIMTPAEERKRIEDMREKVKKGGKSLYLKASTDGSEFRFPLSPNEKAPASLESKTSHQWKNEVKLPSGGSLFTLSKEEVSRVQSDVIKEVQKILGSDISLANTGVLLNHFHWKVEDLVNAWVSDMEGTCEAAGVLIAPYDATIDIAIMHPTSFEFSNEEMTEEITKENQALNVPDDEELYQMIRDLLGGPATSEADDPDLESSSEEEEEEEEDDGEKEASIEKKDEEEEWSDTDEDIALRVEKDLEYATALSETIVAATPQSTTPNRIEVSRLMLRSSTEGLFDSIATISASGATSSETAEEIQERLRRERADEEFARELAAQMEMEAAEREAQDARLAAELAAQWNDDQPPANANPNTGEMQDLATRLRQLTNSDPTASTTQSSSSSSSSSSPTSSSSTTSTSTSSSSSKTEKEDASKPMISVDLTSERDALARLADKEEFADEVLDGYYRLRKEQIAQYEMLELPAMKIREAEEVEEKRNTPAVKQQKKRKKKQRRCGKGKQKVNRRQKRLQFQEQVKIARQQSRERQQSSASSSLSSTSSRTKPTPVVTIADVVAAPTVEDRGKAVVATQKEELDPEEELECDICYNDVARKDGSALPCGHWFCNECWQGNWEVKLADGAEAVKVVCLHADCKVVATKVAATQMLNIKMLERYNQFFLNAFVDTNPNAVWCPSPQACDKITLFKGLTVPSNLDVTCRCEWKFCFHCKEAAHRPATCADLLVWNTKLQKDGVSASWIFENTKACPGCRIPIEKNDGCMHMTCTKCSHEFCWLCKGPWRIHGDATGGYYQCNRYDPKTPSTEEVYDEERFGKWIHYLQRWKHHDDAGATAAGKKGEIESRMKVYEKMYRGWSGKFLLVALALVVECRYLLKYTYISGYTIESDAGRKNFFEFLQGRLEHHTELLYEQLINTPIEELNADRFKASMNATRLYFLHMTDAIEQGLTLGYAPLQVSSNKKQRRRQGWSFFFSK